VRCHGTVLVDLQRHRVVDLLPERTAAVVVAWMVQRPPPQVVCRDRGGPYAEAAHQAAPAALQIADRFHLACNGSAVLERVLAQHPSALRAATRLLSPVSPSPEDQPVHMPEDEALNGTERAQARRDRRRLRYEEVCALHRAGWSITAIAERIGVCRQTVRTYVHADAFPAIGPRRTVLRAGSRYATYLQARWEAGCHEATILHQELQQQGFTGSVRMVQRAVVAWRTGPRRRGRPASVDGAAANAPPAPAPRALSARQATWLLLRPLATLTTDERTMREHLLTSTAAIAQACTAVEDFRQLVHTRDRAALDPWLAAAATSPVAAIRTFAAGMRRDYAAVAAALECAWSSGQVEGQVTKIKLRKRELYGRAKFDLLRRRVLLAG
jgi:transposase